MAMTDLLLEFVADWVSAAPWLTTIWVAAVGACVGSFLNVVIYRLPAGVSLIYPGSRCPNCGHAIRGYDNVPVLSWCLLRGRCRDCRGSIAVRYPLVEATVALLFAFQWWVDVQLGAGVASQPAILATRILVFLLHVSLFCCLLAGALIDLDGQSAPWSLVWPVFVLVSLCAWQQPQALALLLKSDFRTARFLLGQAMVGGLVAGMVASLCHGSRSWRNASSTPTVLGISTGMVLGGLVASLMIVLAAIVRMVLARWTPFATAPMLLTVFVGIYQLIPERYGLGAFSSTTTWLAWGLIGLAALGIGRWIRRYEGVPKAEASDPRAK